MKQLFHSSLLEGECLYPIRAIGATRIFGYLLSNIPKLVEELFY